MGKTIDGVRSKTNGNTIDGVRGKRAKCDGDEQRAETDGTTIHGTCKTIIGRSYCLFNFSIFVINREKSFDQL